MTPALQALADSQNAVQCAVDDGDWSRAAELEIEFRSCLAAVIDSMRDGSPAELSTLRQTLEAAVGRVARLIGEVAHHERRLVRDASMVSTGRRAAAAYTTADELRN